jgi:hypothetical protein
MTLRLHRAGSTAPAKCCERLAKRILSDNAGLPPDFQKSLGRSNITLISQGRFSTHSLGREHRGKSLAFLRQTAWAAHGA